VTARGLRFDASRRLGERRAYLRLARRRPGRAVVGADSALLIEGFPRSASTFAVFAFQTAQPRPVRVAHHLHAPAHVVEAVDLGVPALVLIRPPQDAVVSTVMWWRVGVAPALAAYARFYEHVLPYRDACVVGPFDEATSDFGASIDRVNRRYGTRFGRFAHTPDAVERCYRLIDERARGGSTAHALHAYMSGHISATQLETALRTSTGPPRAMPAAKVARPSPARDARTAAVREAYLAPRLADARRRAERAYSRFVGD
jgi:hypothetical protein